jgi:hypothetical protein
MNIFPTDIQYFITKKHFENNKEIILLYTDPNYSNKELLGYYYPKKIIKEKLKDKVQVYKYLFDYAAKCGNIILMIFLKENRCPWDSGTFARAAEHGNLEIMKWLLENGCPWNESTFSYAAEHGNLDNMKWLKEKRCPWDRWTIIYAAKHGNLENIEWLKANGGPLDIFTFLDVKVYNTIWKT